MSKSSKVSFGSKINKNDPKVILQLNAAENTRRNLYIFSNQTHSALAAKSIIDLLIDKGTTILYNRYLMRKKMPSHMSKLYTASIKEVEHVEQISHDVNQPEGPLKKFEEDLEPKHIPFDNYMSDRLKIGTRKPEVLITEPKTEPRRPASRARSVNIRGPSKSSLISSEKNQGPERLSQSITMSIEPGSVGKGASNNTSLISTSPGGKNKKKRQDLGIVQLEVKKSPRDEVTELLRKEYFANMAEEKKKRQEVEDLHKMRTAIKKKIDLFEKSVFKKQYTYDNNGEIIEVKNRYPPKKGGFNVHMNFNHENVYIEKIDGTRPIERVIAPDWEEPRSIHGYKFQSKHKKKVVVRPPSPDPNLKKFEDLLRFYKIIPSGPFDSSKVTEEMIRELEKKMQLSVIDHIIPAPGVKIIEKDRVKENVGMVPKYSDTGFPLITKGLYNQIQTKALEGYRDISEDDHREVEKALIEKDVKFRKLLGSIIPPYKTPRKPSGQTVSSYNDLNPLDSQDLGNKQKATSASNYLSKGSPETDSKNSPKNTTNRNHQSSIGTVRLADVIQEKIVHTNPYGPLREKNNYQYQADRAKSSTPIKPLVVDQKLNFLEKTHGKEELWSKRKNRKLISASKIPRVKKPEDSGNKSMFVTKGTRDTDISWISPANVTYLEEVSRMDKSRFEDGSKVRNKITVNNDNFLALLEETENTNTILTNA